MNETNLSKRAIASRANGAKSKGPITEEGKRRSSHNAMRHGLLADLVVLKHECPKTFQQVLDQHIAKFNPADDVELDAVEEMAAAHWRIRRAWGIETSLMNHAMTKATGSIGLTPVAAAFSQLAATKELERLDRYETRLHRMYQRFFDRLKMLQAMDPAPEPDSAPEPSQPDARQPDSPEIPPLPNEPNSPADPFPNPIRHDVKPLQIPNQTSPNEPKPASYSGRHPNEVRFYPVIR